MILGEDTSPTPRSFFFPSKVPLTLACSRRFNPPPPLIRRFFSWTYASEAENSFWLFVYFVLYPPLKNSGCTPAFVAYVPIAPKKLAPPTSLFHLPPPLLSPLRFLANLGVDIAGVPSFPRSPINFSTSLFSPVGLVSHVVFSGSDPFHPRATPTTQGVYP